MAEKIEKTETKARELLDKHNWSIREVVDNEEI